MAPIQRFFLNTMANLMVTLQFSWKESTRCDDSLCICLPHHAIIHDYTILHAHILHTYKNSNNNSSNNNHDYLIITLIIIITKIIVITIIIYYTISYYIIILYYIIYYIIYTFHIMTMISDGLIGPWPILEHDFFTLLAGESLPCRKSLKWIDPMLLRAWYACIYSILIYKYIYI